MIHLAIAVILTLLIGAAICVFIREVVPVEARIKQYAVIAVAVITVLIAVSELVGYAPFN